jgi:O-succinylbenzoic acid--CoA ligase
MSQGHATLNPLCLFLDWAESRPNEIALVDGANCYCWLEIKQRSTFVASHLIQQGMRRGDTLAIIGKNHSHHLWLFLAAMTLDIPVSFIAPSPEAVVKSKLTSLTQPDHQVWVYHHADELDIPDYHSIQNVDNGGLFNERLLLQLFSSSSAQPSPQLEFTSDFNSIATLTFTSGSMGKPKVVAHSHQQHLASAKGLLQHFQFTQDDCWLLSLPLYHVSGLAIVYRWLYRGSCLKVGSGDLEHDIVAVSHASLVPVQLARLLGNPALELNLTHVLLGGSHIPSLLCQQAEQRGIETWLGYGMTEAASTVTAKRANAHTGVGNVLPQRTLFIHNQRIMVGGGTLALGYYDQGELTPLVNKQGWFDTKDIGEWRDGELVVLGRADNMFISGGENIHCEEIETALMSHPSIIAAMVLAVADDDYGARPIALIDAGENVVSRGEIERVFVGCLEKYKWPIDYLSLPQDRFNQGIKLSRRDVIEWFKAQNTHYLVMS